MYYVTYWEKQDPPQISIANIISGTLPEARPDKLVTKPMHPRSEEYKASEPWRLKYAIWVNALNTLAPIAEKYKGQDMSEHYHHFRIPKKTGGWRDINAPNPELKLELQLIKNTFENNLHCLANDAAYAYVKGRCTVDALKKHQENHAHWFLKLDIKDFFPNHDKTYIMQTLAKIYPFAELMNTHYTLIEDLIHVCLLNNELPQGSPISPYLTNILFVPLDYHIQLALNRFNKSFTYTRYADDIIISCPEEFNFTNIVNIIERLLNETPFTLKREKTRYGSYKGRNWNLGLMYNKDMKITIGHEKKQKFRAKLHSFCLSTLPENESWSIMQKKQLAGEISYYRMIEPEYIDYIITKYGTKFNINIKKCLQQDMTF